MGVNPALGAKELFITARGRHRHILQPDFRNRLTRVPGVLDLDRPPFRILGRRPNSINAAARSGDEGRSDAHFLQDRYHTVDGVTFADTAGVDLDARTVEP